MTFEKTYGELKDGDKVYIQGYLFTIKNVKRYFNESNKDVVKFTGICTNCNSKMNGATYGGMASLKITCVLKKLIIIGKLKGIKKQIQKSNNNDLKLLDGTKNKIDFRIKTQ
jgi:hypothetical protein